MSELLHQLIFSTARRQPDRPALSYRKEVLTFDELRRRVTECALGFAAMQLQRSDRIAVYLEKRIETVIAIFGASAAGCVFVPINPLLRSRQVGYILRDCNVRLLVTSRERLAILGEEIARCPDLQLIVLVDGDGGNSVPDSPGAISWGEMASHGQVTGRQGHRVIESDMAAILYTSGSTGMPKGVVLSHRNVVAGAKSVSQYLENNDEDRILALLPLSFDAGFSQLTTAFNVGAQAVLMNYLLPHDAVRACAERQITGLTCVPPLWIQLAQQTWPEAAAKSMRYFANTGGRMPKPLLDRLRGILPYAKPYLMYGLTEAFRSTYLDPGEVDRRPESIGKAIPNVEILVVREDGQPCAAGEQGELIHRGPLVAMGYWNDAVRTAERFRPTPDWPSGLSLPEIAVWSGDIVRKDEEGFLYFVGRHDEMIKTSGYRVSPTEIEEVIYATGMANEAAAFGVTHPTLGQAIVVVIVPPAGQQLNVAELSERCRQQLPLYMVPAAIIDLPALPRNPNGKIDRKSLASKYAALFEVGVS